MPTIKRFEDLEIWKMAREQANGIFTLNKEGDFSKDYSLKNQINAAAGSVMDNIAEGFERFSNKEFAQFLVISKGSNGEVRSQLYRAFDRKYISEEILNSRLESSIHLGNKIKSFLDYLQSSNYKSKPKNSTNIQPPTSNK
jgi:four helix bundle protein